MSILQESRREQMFIDINSISSHPSPMYSIVDTIDNGRVTT